VAVDAPPQAAADAARLATVAGLREKLARLGGLAGAAARPPSARTQSDAWAPSAPRVPRQPGFEPEATSAGTAWVRRVDVDLGPLLDAAGAASTAAADDLLRLTAGVRRAVDAGGTSAPEAAAAADDGPVAVLDIESLGLRGSGVLAFLVGVGLQRGRRLEVHQMLLADPGDEAALLTAVLDRLAGCAALVTYNGRSFDVPTLRARCIVNRLGDHGLEGRPHCDLLGPVRRLFRDRLGACTLRQAEVDLLAMERIDDVPGFEAPARYRAWLRGAGPELLAGVVRHNQLDLCATAVLGARLAAHVEGSMVQPVHVADQYRLALHLERRRAHPERAEQLLRQAASARAAPWDRRAGHRLALRLRRAGGPHGEAEALELLRGLWRAEPGDMRGARALAIALERGGFVEEVLEVSRHSLRLCAAMPAWRLGALRGAPPAGWCADWERRLARLTQRLDRMQRQRERRRNRQPRSITAPLAAAAPPS
jgi:uncharacterized protein YprB with RNaseH-like and TPR domain